MDIQKPTGEFRKYIEVDGRWRHVYIVSTYWQQDVFGNETKMVEFKFTKNSKTVHCHDLNFTTKSRESVKMLKVYLDRLTNNHYY